MTIKIHIRCEGRLITFLLKTGQESDINQAEKLMQQGDIRLASGHSRSRPKHLVVDKGYASKAFRHYLRRQGIDYTIPHQSNEHHKGFFDKRMYRKRNIVERLINRIKLFRRIATDYENEPLTFQL